MERRPDRSRSVGVHAWAEELGHEHGAREQAATLAARTESDRAAERANVSLDRWTRIVGAITHLAQAYNAGFDRSILSIVEDRAVSSRPTVTIRAGDEGAPSLFAALEGTLICIRSRDARGGLRETEQPLRSDRSDDQTAAYVVQDWMERL